MNYYVTHCDKPYLKYAERLFESLARFSQYQIVFFTVDFDYENKFDNVIPIRFDSSNIEANIKDKKAKNVFLKPLILNDYLLEIPNSENHCFLYLDADCFAMDGCDSVFDHESRITNYPLLNLSCQEYMMKDGRGNPFIDEHHNTDLNRTLEAPLLKKLGLDVNIRTNQYLQTGTILFNTKCREFLKQWKELCFSSAVVDDWEHLAPYHEETVINCLLWQTPWAANLDRAIINVPEDQAVLDQMLLKLNNPKPHLQRISTFCTIPSIDSMKNLHFFHGKCDDKTYNLLMNSPKPIYLKIHSTSLGDTLAATPTVRKLSEVYGTKIQVITHQPEIFKNNKCVSNVRHIIFDECCETSFQNAEVFDIFLGLGEKNEFGVEKKHNAIDIRQFHAIDLGFALTKDEMHYDYTPDPYEEIKGLPRHYVALHVAETWPSRTYPKAKWQELIDLLNSKSIPVVLIGKNSHETGFHNIDKKTIDLFVNLGLDLTNQLTLSQCWHVIDRAEAIITMDSGLLHLAGATDTQIIQLGSSIKPELRAPYRNGKQDYKYQYIGGPCELFCASDIRYGVKEWGTINGVPPLVGCLENKVEFECHPSPKAVFQAFLKINSEKETDVFECLEFSRDSKQLSENKVKTILFIAPHLSTGGSPEYLRWLIEIYKKQNWRTFVVEYCYYGEYEVQRNKIIEMVGSENFLSLAALQDTDEYYDSQIECLLEVIKKSIKPDVIHLNEGAESFGLKPLTQTMLDFLYDKERSFHVAETIHNVFFDFENKKYIPDEFLLCSPAQLKKVNHLDSIATLAEMKLPLRMRPDRTTALKKLGLSSSTFHVLNVGLFTEEKNQKYLFDIAEKLQNKDIQFHFIGNTCFLDQCGITEEQKMLPNCIIHGEKDNVDDFYAAMDLFAFPSIKELNPIVLKEALSWSMPVYLNKLEIYEDKFDNNVLVQYIEGDNLLEYLESVSKTNSSIGDTAELSEFFPNFEEENPKISIEGYCSDIYEVRFDSIRTGITHYKTQLRTGMWASCACSPNDTKICVTNLRTKRIFHFQKTKITKHIINESGSLGDCLAWLPIVDEYAASIKEKVNFYTPYKKLFDKEKYPLIDFYDYAEKDSLIGNNSFKKIGYFGNDSLGTPLQNQARKILGLADYITSARPHFKPSFIKERPIKQKYVCIATHSTAQLKYWNNPKGWDQTIQYLKDLGYEVVCVDRDVSYGRSDKTNYIPQSCIHRPGESLEDTINDIYHCEFFIGLSSGLSWVAWACEKPVVMVCGFLEKGYHFYTPYYVQNKDVCNCCWHDPSQRFDAGDWMWCGKGKDFECSKAISFEMVKENIDQLIKDNNL